MKKRIFLATILMIVFLLSIRISLNTIHKEQLWESVLDGFSITILSFAAMFAVSYNKHRWLSTKKEQPPLGCRIVWNTAVFGFTVSTWWAIISSSISITAQEHAGFLVIANLGLVVGFIAALILKGKNNKQAFILVLVFVLTVETLFGWRISTFVATQIVLTALWHFTTVLCLENIYKHLDKKPIARQSSSMSDLD